MTNFTKNLMIAAAALVLSASVVSAQTVLTADIPFAFQISGKVLPAGTYRVANTSNSGLPIFLLRNSEGQSAVVMPVAANDPAKAWKSDRNPRLAFSCGSERCILLDLWTGGDAPAYRMSNSKTVDLNSHIAVVVMRPDKAD